MLVRFSVPAVREYILENGEFLTTFDEVSVVPSETLKNFLVEHGTVASASVLMVYGRLDAALATDNDQTPSFVYLSELSTDWGYLERDYIYY